MPCRKVEEHEGVIGYGKPAGGGYATEADCLQACKEGACCNGTTCTVKPQCQCNAAAGEVFKGVGTVCSPNPCLVCAGECEFGLPRSYPVTISEYANELPPVCFPVNKTLDAELYVDPFSSSTACYLWYSVYPYEERIPCSYDCSYNPGPAGAVTSCNSITVDLRQMVAGGRTATIRLVLGGNNGIFTPVRLWRYNAAVFVPCNAAGCPVFPVVIDELLQPDPTGQNWIWDPPTSPIRVSMTIPDPSPNPLP